MQRACPAEHMQRFRMAFEDASSRGLALAMRRRTVVVHARRDSEHPLALAAGMAGAFI
jgi:hypothetical protein